MNDYDEIWQRVDPDIRKRAVEALRENFHEDDKELIRGAIRKHGKHEWIHEAPFGHMFFGMQVRNFLRQNVARDEELPGWDEYYGEGTDVRNWDDYYVQAVEEAING